MESISRTASEFAAPERQTIEQLLGHPLRDDQQVTISVQSGATEPMVQYPPHCQTEEDRQRYRSIVAETPSYDDLLQIVIDPPAEWLAEKD